MTREELKGKQTPGDWIVIASWDDYIITADGLGEDAIIWQDGPHDTPTMTEADATLAAEAGTVANRTGMWPEDLVAWLRKFEDLTPGGSEFANSPSEVYSYLRNRMDAVKEQHKRMKELEEGLRCCEFAMSNNKPQSKDGQEWEWGDVLTHARAILNKPTA